MVLTRSKKQNTSTEEKKMSVTETPSVIFSGTDSDESDDGTGTESSNTHKSLESSEVSESDTDTEKSSSKEEETRRSKQLSKKKQMTNLVSSFLDAAKTKIESSDNDSSTTDDEDENSGDEYFMSLPPKIKEDKTILKTYEKIKKYIKDKRTPNLVQILKSQIEFKRKVELTESMIILDNCEPFTEEYLQIRSIIMKLLPMFKKEYKENKKYKQSLKVLEKQSSELDQLSDIPVRILNLKTTEENKKIIYRKYMEFRQMSRDDEEYGKLERWLKMSLQLPFDKLIQGSMPQTVNTEYLNNVRKKLDEVLYGMNDVKEQIILFLHVRLLNPSIRGCSLGLIGPPGCGKTTIARSLAEIIDYPFQQISFGGVNSTDYLKGHNYTYVGSRPGEIVNCLTRMKHKNGILFFDEYDKVSQNADIVSTLLHVTDFSQNSTFRDNYFSEIEIDLSSLWFIYSMNELPENSALRDRIFPIMIQGYTEKEKIRIIVDYLFPRHLKDHLFQKTDIIVSDQVAGFIISTVCKSTDKGIRSIEKAVKDIIRKISFLYHHREKCEFSLSFKTKQTIELPLVLTNDWVSACLNKNICNNNTESYMNMYA